MAATKQSCKNHPEKFTTKRCYNCKQHICTDCQQHGFHHIFCSIKCLILWKAKDLFSVFKPSREFTWYIFLLLLSNVILYNLLAGRIDSSRDEISSTSRQVDSVHTYPAPHDFVIDSLRYAVRGKFKIEVSGQDNTVISLMHNGRFVESLINREQGFSFEDVQLTKGQNTFEIFALTHYGKSLRLDSFTLNYSAPRLDYLMQPVYRVKTKDKKIAFTFDGGSSNKGTKKILDILRMQNIKCTMFVTGQFVENYPDIVGQIIKDGHEVGNHSYNHPHFTNLEIDGSKTTRKKVTKKYFSKQLNITDSLYHAAFGKHMVPYWRAPFGEINREVLYWAAELGYRHIGWSYHCDSWDWVADKSSQLYRSAKEIEDHFLTLDKERGLNGKIILMHLGSERKDDFPYLTLAALIKELKSRNYKFLKVSELLKN